MAKNVVINGVTYSDVPSVKIPLSGTSGSYALFYDTSDGTAESGDIRTGKVAWVNGVRTIGNLPTKTAASVTVNANRVDIPMGIYDTSVSKTVPTGTVTPTASITSGYVGNTETDYAVTVNPAASVSAGYVSGQQTGAAFTKYIQVEEKTATPSSTAQDITPSEGKLLKKVRVNAVSLSGTATASDVLAGKTFYNTSLTPVTGTATVPLISQDSTTKVLTIS